ncbi:glutathione S-transferase family protein [Sphingobium sufflavum]|uniref:glutathione S-transferase family protein n=1 Tax=Sphingobium sufflavum TaxID=1129547 RepID=UPI001F2B2197|nr:glutathione S-transferase family protein [Sphingobium sufflavum]MCE7797754.1 glutathione S-transferase family protein [Sphingobium sufflavum]
MTDLIFYTNPQSRGRIARWMLEEVGAPYRTAVLDYATAMKAPDYLAINPMGKVPAIVHDGRVVTECAAICAYLADAFPQAGLAPSTTDRADYYRWMFFVAGPLEAAVTTKALHVTVAEEQKRMVGFGSLEDVLATLEALLSTRDYVTGSGFTAADVYVGAHLRWGMGFGTIPASPVFTAYSDRLGERPALIRATAMDNALTPTRPAG